MCKLTILKLIMEPHEINQSTNQSIYFRHKPIDTQENIQTDDNQTTETTNYRLQNKKKTYTE